MLKREGRTRDQDLKTLEELSKRVVEKGRDLREAEKALVNVVTAFANARDASLDLQKMKKIIQDLSEGFYAVDDYDVFNVHDASWKLLECLKEKTNDQL